MEVMGENTGRRNNEQTDSTVKKYIGKGLRDVDDTVRVATGFILGGITATFFDLNVLPIILIGGLMVVGEMMYGLTVVWVEAYRMQKESTETESK